MKNKQYNPDKKNKGLVRVFLAIRYSLDGVLTALQEESAFRQECLMTLVFIPYAIWLPVGNIETILMVFSIFLVLIVELLNSSVEAAIDRISFSENILSKRAKDYASAAVFFSILSCLGIYAAFTIQYWKTTV